MTSQRTVMWFRRDLRLGDHPALASAGGQFVEAVTGHSVLPLFVIDPRLWQPAGAVRRAYLLDSLHALNESLDGGLHVRVGDPVEVVPNVVRDIEASEVHVTADFGPYGQRRDLAVETALDTVGAKLERTGSPYAVSPGRVRKPDGTPYRVFTPFARQWAAHGWRAPLRVQPVNWLDLPGGQTLPAKPDLGPLTLPTAGETAALDRWGAFLSGPIEQYAIDRDRADLNGTSLQSAALRWGEVHPRTLLADLGESKGHNRLRTELAWREFYADVLFHKPESASTAWDSRLSNIEVDHGDQADEYFKAWSQGRTGYPFVDAGMRQLLGEGWMHNRVRMVVASFLIKDLHLDWTRGARWFMRWLRDGDLASNQHGWQWVAGTGTDAAPYFRIFNPVTQGLKFDPNGDYVRRWIPELREVSGAEVHEPWKLRSGGPSAYPDRIVDHASERTEALRRLGVVTAR